MMTILRPLRLRTALVGGFATAAALTILLSGATLKFYDDDPVWLERDTQDASGMQPLDVSLFVDLADNLVGTLGDTTPNVRARNVNTVDEVPDSNWFTNRAGRRAISPEEITKGPDTTTGPAEGQWTVTASKSDGITPGFTIRDSTGQLWFLKFDPPGHRGMGTGTEVVVTQLMWALGFNVPANRIAYLQREQLVIGDGARFDPPGGNRRAMRLADLDMLLKRADREPNGSYRVVASKALAGKPIGRIRFYGTRPDDPNDTVPHEHRRELRGYGVFAAWVNHVDAKAINSFDTLVEENGRSVVRHHLLDFGSTLGSGGIGPRDYWEGYEYVVEPHQAAKQVVSFGLYFPEWHTLPTYEARSIGRLPRDNTRFNPERWKPRVPNQAFLRARADDKFWAARKLVALTDPLLRAAVQTGQFGDPEAEGFLVKTLAERRDAIARTYLPAINPIADPALDTAGILTFRNAAVDAGVAKAPERYRAIWSRFDNAAGTSQQIGESSAITTRLEAPAGLSPTPGVFIKVELSATGGPNPSWEKPVHAFFRYRNGEWRLVGFERLPEG
jgi:hypothetical protein